MRYGIIADIHSNLEALKVAIDALKGVQQFWCLGDIVGYGPDPVECLEMLHKLKQLSVVGNHDLGAVNKIDLADFNADAAEACLWTRRQLPKQEIAYLQNLPLTLKPRKDVLLVHGSPNDPVWEYVLSAWQVDDILADSENKVVFVGHSHLPFVFQKIGDEPSEVVRLKINEKIFLNLDDAKYLINPGSVGQPRDGDPRTSFMVFDSADNSLTYHRLPYVIERTQKRMEAAHLPIFLNERLSFGM